MNRRAFFKSTFLGLTAVLSGSLAVAIVPIRKKLSLRGMDFSRIKMWGVRNIDGYTTEEILKNGFGEPIWSAKIHVSRNLMKG